MQPQDKAIHDMLQAQSKELRQFLNSLEKKDSLQNICFMRTQDQVNQNTVNICGLQESIKRIEQQMNSQTTKKLEQKINALEENMDLIMIQAKKIIDEATQEQMLELSKMLKDVQNNLKSLQDFQPKPAKQLTSPINSRPNTNTTSQSIPLQRSNQFLLPLQQQQFLGQFPQPQPQLQQLQAQITELKNKQQEDQKKTMAQLEQLKDLIEKSGLKVHQINSKNLQISDFYQATEQISQANILDQNYSQSQFEFIVEEDESEFSIGIIQDGDLENQDLKTKFLQIQFPSGQLIRGAEDPINFLPRQFLRNDRVQMKVLKEKGLFMVTLNGIDIPPIKIKEELSYSHAFVVKSEHPLQDIISQDSEY